MMCALSSKSTALYKGLAPIEKTWGEYKPLRVPKAPLIHYGALQPRVSADFYLY